MMRWALVGCLALSACGEAGVPRVRALVAGVLPGAEAPAPPAAPDAQALRDMAQNGPVLLVSVPGLGLQSPATPAAVNGHKATWVLGGATMALQGGFVLATRAMGEDLMAVEVEGFGAAMAEGGRYTRQMEWLDGRDSIERISYSCDITVIGGQSVTVLDQSYDTTLYEDRCAGDGHSFTNRYWVDGERQLRQTEQWISKTVGYMKSQQI